RGVCFRCWNGYFPSPSPGGGPMAWGVASRVDLEELVGVATYLIDASRWTYSSLGGAEAALADWADHRFVLLREAAALALRTHRPAEAELLASAAVITTARVA